MTPSSLPSSTPLARVEGLAFDAPRASVEALRPLPQYPHTVPLDPELWRRMTVAAAPIHPPNAELSFATSWLWGGGDDITMSRIGATVAIRFTDRPGHATLVPLPGIVLTPSALARLSMFFQHHDVGLLTSTAVDVLRPAIDRARFVVTEDPGDADTLCEIDRLAELAGPDLAGRRKEANRFERRWGDATELSVGTMAQAWARDHAQRATGRWVENRVRRGHRMTAENRRELDGLAAWPTTGPASEVRVFALSVGGEPAAVSLLEPMWGRVQMAIFMKTDHGTYAGITAAFRRRICRVLRDEHGPGGLLNLQQTAGVEALGQMKDSYDPIRKEPKFGLAPSPALAIEEDRRA